MRQNGEMRRLVAPLLAALLLVAACGAVAAAASPVRDGAAAATTLPGATTSTAAERGEAASGTSPWVLVLIGAVAGGAVGVFTGFSRRRRAEAKR